MKHTAFYQMFLDLLRDLYDSENQIITALPKMIQAASHKELKEALSDHLEETKGQVNRLKEVFSILNEQPIGRTCKVTQSLIQEGQEILQKNVSPAVKDAFLIIGAQKIEHLEIASYGSVKALAYHFKDIYTSDDYQFDDIVDIIDDILDQEIDADKKLTSVAEGNFFKEGINEEAEQEIRATRK